MSLLTEFLHQHGIAISQGDFLLRASTVATAVASALFGGWLGSRTRTKQKVVDELNAIRVAVALCFSISNKGLAIKRQHVRPTKQRYDKIQTRMSLPQFNPTTIELDLQTLANVKFPTAALEKCVYEKINAGGKALVTLADLSTALEAFTDSTKYRNDLIKEFRSLGKPELIACYLGKPSPQGHTDTRFAHNVLALYEQTDDCIFFANELADELIKYGNGLRKRHAWKYRLPIPKIEGADWSIAEAQDLLPERSNYADWLRGFKNVPTRSERLKRWFKQIVSTGE